MDKPKQHVDRAEQPCRRTRKHGARCAVRATAWESVKTTDVMAKVGRDENRDHLEHHERTANPEPLYLQA
jgi:hypothetical protein